ncbi:MAG: sodium:solute symporter [Bacteroidales bacterium]|nr:sodium:solute symporter [Bacteroidales bacterium]
MSPVDWIIIGLFLVALTTIGFFFSRRNRNLEDYFVAGRSMPTWIVALAATGTSISAGTFVGSPELGFNTNLTFIMSCVGAVIGGLFVALLVLPRLYRAKTITIYGYIGDRFGETSKRATSVMFLFGQLFTSGSRLFIAAIAVSVILFGSIHFQFIMYSIIILGIVSTIYTMAGGIKGLLYIDTLQILLVIGTGIAALVLVALSIEPRLGLGEIWRSLTDGGMVKLPARPEYGLAADGTLKGWAAGSKVQLVDPSFRFDRPYNLIGALVAYAIFKFAQFSTDHEFVQRQLTCRSVKEAGVSLVWSQLLAIPIVAVFLCIGLLLWVKFTQDPGAMPSDFFADARDVFPQFICRSVPTGVRGLMVVGLLAAALSSFNSAINAMASSFVTDLYLPIRKDRGRPVTGDAGEMASSKKMAALMGVILTGFAIVTAVMQQSSGLNLVDFATGVMCFSYAGMLGVFIVALYTRRGSTASVIAALVAGLLTVLLLQPYILTPLSQALLGRTLFIAWPWWCPIGATVSILVCLAGKPKQTI